MPCVKNSSDKDVCLYFEFCHVSSRRTFEHLILCFVDSSILDTIPTYYKFCPSMTKAVYTFGEKGIQLC